MKIPGKKIVTGAAVGAALGACVGCETIPEEAIEPDEEMTIIIKGEIDKTGRNLETIKLLAEVADPLPGVDGKRDTQSFISDAEDAHDKLVDMFEDGDILVMYKGDYESSYTPEDAVCTGLFVGGYTPDEGDDTLVAFLGHFGELVTLGPSLEHEASHGLTGTNSHHHSEVIDSMVTDDKPTQAEKALEAGEFVYTLQMIHQTAYDLTEFIANEETRTIKHVTDQVNNDYPLEMAQETYQNGVELRDVPKEDWVREMAAWYYHHESDIPDHPDYPLAYKFAPNFCDYAAGLGITEDEMRRVLTESDIYERRQDILNEALQELTEAYGEEVREGNETNFREGQLREGRL